MLVRRLAILGIGLIGASLARALKKAGAVKTVIGFDRDMRALRRAVQLGVIDRDCSVLSEAVKGADMIVVATPLAAVGGLFSGIRDTLGETTIITDVGSAKAAVIEAARAELGVAFSRFVPGHPIAGGEQSGVEASVADLYVDHRVILTPLAETSADALATVSELWRLVGADVVTFDVEQHDTLFAATSHLPHMLAYALVDCLAAMDEREQVFQFAAGGFSDFTRIASSDPIMWRDICLANRQPLLAAMGQFEAHFDKLHGAISEGDSDALLEIFNTAKSARDCFIRSRNTSNKPLE